MKEEDKQYLSQVGMYLVDLFYNQNKMEKEFVPYELALRLKELGFDKSTFGGWCHPFNNHKPYLQLNQEGEYDITAPTFSQALRWFRENYGLWFRPDYYDEMKEYNFQGSIHELGKYSAVADIGNHKTPEEAELACLEKLLEIVESKSE